MIFLQRLVEPADLGERAGVEQMRVGGIEVRPLLLKIVQRRQRIGRTLGGKLGLRLAEGISGGRGPSASSGCDRNAARPR